jgi:hypothetical protein
VARGRCWELGHQLSYSAEGACTDTPDQDQLGHRPAGAPAPGLPSQGGQCLQGQQAGLLRGHAGPQRIQLALESMQMTQEIPPAVLTMGPPDGPPVLHGVFGNAQQLSRGPETHPCRQGRGPTSVCGGLGAEARIRRAGAR